jgi:hypothetical protein
VLDIPRLEALWSPKGRARVECRIAAILVADVASHSRRVEVDKEGTLSPLKALRAEAIDPKVTAASSKSRATACSSGPLAATMGWEYFADGMIEKNL